MMRTWREELWPAAGRRWRKLFMRRRGLTDRHYGTVLAAERNYLRNRRSQT